MFYLLPFFFASVVFLDLHGMNGTTSPLGDVSQLLEKVNRWCQEPKGKQKKVVSKRKKRKGKKDAGDSCLHELHEHWNSGYSKVPIKKELPVDEEDGAALAMQQMLIQESKKCAKVASKSDVFFKKIHGDQSQEFYIVYDSECWYLFGKKEQSRDYVVRLDTLQRCCDGIHTGCEYGEDGLIVFFTGQKPGTRFVFKKLLAAINASDAPS